jgi:hypothetical protein
MSGFPFPAGTFIGPTLTIMLSRYGFALLTFVPFVSIAQTDTTKMKVVKSAPIEMKASGTTVASSVSSAVVVNAPAITGDFTVSSAHPSCLKDKRTEERARCTAAEVLARITAQLKAEPPKSLDVVTVDFDVDEYGEVKAIRANTGTEPDLGKALIVALYGLPKFEAAKKGEVRTASHCSFSYAVNDLFPAPPASTTSAAAPVAAVSTEAPPPPTRTTVQSGSHMITGAFSVPSAHPACAKSPPKSKAGSSAEDMVKCTAEEVLKQIRSKLKAEAPAYLDMVVVDFDIDQYGDVKSIRANCSSEPELGQAVIVALYGMPKFIPAKKDAARVASHCTFQYPVADLFTKP